MCLNIVDRNNFGGENEYSGKDRGRYNRGEGVFMLGK